LNNVEAVGEKKQNRKRVQNNRNRATGLTGQQTVEGEK